MEGAHLCKPIAAIPAGERVGHAGQGVQLLAAVDDLGGPRGALVGGEGAEGTGTGRVPVLDCVEMAGGEPQGGCGDEGERDGAG